MLEICWKYSKFSNIICNLTGFMRESALLKNAGLKTSWVKYRQTQQLGCFGPAVGLNV